MLLEIKSPITRHQNLKNKTREEVEEMISRIPDENKRKLRIQTKKSTQFLNKKQLEVLRNVLSAITKKSQSNHGDLYDKMGRIGKKR